MIYFEGYPHLFCDNELIQTAKRRRAFVSAQDCVVEHLHPHWGLAPSDELYDRHSGPEALRATRARYEIPCHLWHRTLEPFAG